LANDQVGPAITISGVANLGTSTSSPTGRDLDLYEIADNITTLRGGHSLKFGADFLYDRVNITFPGALQGAYTFSSLANLQANRYVTYQQAFGAPSLFQSNPNIGFFAQDEWRARPDLTVNVGIRYDLQFLPDPIKTDTGNVAPRLGLAYAPGSGKTVMRELRHLLRPHTAARDLERVAARRHEIQSRLVLVRPTGRASLSQRGNCVPGRFLAEHNDDRSDDRKRLRATGEHSGRARAVFEHVACCRLPAHARAAPYSLAQCECAAVPGIGGRAESGASESELRQHLAV
jgi:hypothetical protein